MPDARSEKKLRLAAEKRSRRAELRRLALAAAALKQEDLDEAIAPAVQRLGVRAGGGADERFVRGPRVVRDGITFRVASPLSNLEKMGAKRVEHGNEPTILRAHVRAADRLMVVWEECQSVSIGTSSYEGRSGGGGDAGVMSQTVLRAVTRQHEAKKLVEGAMGRLGPLWGVVKAVALEGQDVKSWADVKKMEARAARGYLRAGMDVLVAYWMSVDGLDRPRAVRGVEVKERVDA